MTHHSLCYMTLYGTYSTCRLWLLIDLQLSIAFTILYFFNKQPEGAGFSKLLLILLYSPFIYAQGLKPNIKRHSPLTTHKFSIPTPMLPHWHLQWPTIHNVKCSSTLLLAETAKVKFLKKCMHFLFRPFQSMLQFNGIQTYLLVVLVCLFFWQWDTDFRGEQFIYLKYEADMRLVYTQIYCMYVSMYVCIYTFIDPVTFPGPS